MWRAVFPAAHPPILSILAWLSLWQTLAVDDGRWCERVVQVRDEDVVNVRREDVVPCAEVYQYTLEGWHLDRDRTRRATGSGGALCYIYKNEDPGPIAWNRTVRTCCEGWSGPHCTEGAMSVGPCFSTWHCQDVSQVRNLSLFSMAECCNLPWGHSWQNASSGLCFTCSREPLKGALPSSRLRLAAPLALLAQQSYRHPPFATCLTWGGLHYRTFDGRHFRFRGNCTYILAAASDGTWAVYVSSGHGGCVLGQCQRDLRILFGLDLVMVHGRNVSLNGATVTEREPLLRKGISVWWLGDFLFLDSGLGIRVKFDGRSTIYVTVGTALRNATRGLCGVYNDNPAGGGVPGNP